MEQQLRRPAWKLNCWLWQNTAKELYGWKRMFEAIKFNKVHEGLIDCDKLLDPTGTAVDKLRTHQSFIQSHITFEIHNQPLRN